MAKKVNHSQDEWFEVTDDMWRQPYELKTKLKLLADENLPHQVITELRSAHVLVKTAAENNLCGVSDTVLLTYTKNAGMVLLTLDADFWSDRNFPLKEGGGVIWLDVNDSDIQGALRAFGLIYGTFAKSFGGNWSRGLKARACSDRFYLKMVSSEGRRIIYELKLDRRRLVAREVIP
jgi:predicted nuclease of predicted toxin-antitoxin system